MKKRCITNAVITLLLLLSIFDGKSSTMQDVVFREYDIRGKVGSELNIDEVYDVIRALAFYFVKEEPTTKTIAVGMDGRIHSPAIKEQVCKALRDSGLDVIFIGMCTSPALYFALHTLPVDAGIMVTASHNPKEYNGLKICLAKESVWGVQIKEIRDLFKAKARITSSTAGKLIEHPIVDEYVNWLVQHFTHLRGMELSAIVDCGNGAAGTVLPKLVKEMDWQHVQLLYADVDGTYPHHEADPIVEKNMYDVKQLLAKTDIQVGIGLDGDGDRMAPMTKQGYLVPGDRLLALFSKSVLENYPGATIVFDIKSSAGLIELLEKWGAIPQMSSTGHAIIKEQMKKYGAVLGGELSCHFCFHDRYFGYDDGIYAMLRLFELLIESGKSLQELLTVFPHKVSTPEIRINCPEEQMSTIIAQVKKVFSARSDTKIITIDGVRATMDYGWGIVRRSNTQPVLCLRFESDTQQGLQRVKQDFFEVLAPYFDVSLLREQINL